ncbi:MAG: 6-phosphogluconolactonase [Desulfobacterales bacterium]
MDLRPKINIYTGRKQLSVGLAAYVAQLAAKASQERGRFHVAFSGGSLLDIIAPALSSNPLRDVIDWSTWHVFWADERWVPLSSPDSNYGVAKRLLFSRVSIPGGQVHTMDDSQPPKETAKTYECKLLNILLPGAHQIPQFDLILLGIGEDGHTASLFPGHPALKETRRWVVPILNAPKPPPVRITMTLPVINHARNVVFVAAGSTKGTIISDVLHSKDEQPKLPVQMVKPSNGELHWFIDRPAADRAHINPLFIVKEVPAGSEENELS